VPPAVLNLKNRAQLCAPLMYFNEDQEYVVRLTNLGLQQRPDLFDSHTIHWHGFRNVIPMFDGEPSSSVAVPIGRVFDYDYRPHNAGTYMYHCHFEDTEHVHMGMTGPLFVRPKQNTGAFGQPMGRYVYNDGDGSTRYDREYVIFLSEVWNESHWDDAHIQLPDWTDYKADFFLMNGRVYPDTLLANNIGTAPGTTRPDLDTQPYSSLIKCNSGERVLLRCINLGFTKASLTLEGVRMQVVGQDAVLLRGRGGASTSFTTNTVTLGPGESVDAIFQAPVVTSERTYLLYNRNLPGISNNGGPGLGGQMTEIHVRPSGPGAYPAQINPNDL
jgi:FtsP/CotA-like multicopper oxidase with cupredoxin domain